MAVRRRPASRAGRIGSILSGRALPAAAISIARWTISSPLQASGSKRLRILGCRDREPIRTSTKAARGLHDEPHKPESVDLARNPYPGSLGKNLSGEEEQRLSSGVQCLH